MRGPLILRDLIQFSRSELFPKSFPRSMLEACLADFPNVGRGFDSHRPLHNPVDAVGFTGL
jgi:hypothetical protein